jgi:NAD(P)-dependent dehydrogenase (short-subunit alcohol dehydrogenase family)
VRTDLKFRSCAVCLRNHNGTDRIYKVKLYIKSMLVVTAASALLSPPLSAAVTGANRGLGLALADQLAAAGVNVLLTTRSGRETSRPAEVQLLRRGHRGVEAYDAPLDVSNPISRAAFIDYCDQRGGLDIIINNAAICSEGWSMDVVRQTLRTNVLGPIALTHGLLPGMLHRRRGFVINISSGDGELVYLSTALQEELRITSSSRQLLRLLACASPPRNAFGSAPAHGPTPAYCISKAALNAATQLVAQALPAPTDCGVWVGAVCPGDVLTRMCTAREAALTPEAAAADVIWLLERQLAEGCALPSGRFWRAREQISL